MSHIASFASEANSCGSLLEVLHIQFSIEHGVKAVRCVLDLMNVHADLQYSSS